MHIGKQSNLLETSYLSHVSVGSELHTEMLTENCLLRRKQLNPSIRIRIERDQATHYNIKLH